MTAAPPGEPIPRVVVSAVIRDEEQRVLLVRREDDGSWCCPGGHIDFGETLLEALHREVLEEAGVTIEVERLVGIYSVLTATVAGSTRRTILPLAFGSGSEFGSKAPVPGKHYLAISFACRHRGGEPRPGGDELDARWFRLDELPAMRSNHAERIRDARQGGAPVIA